MGGLFEPATGLPVERSSFGVIAPRFSGGLSVLSSLLIIYVILRGNTKLSTVYHRILFGMSCADVVGSTAMALTTLPMPRVDPDVLIDSFGKRIGTDRTCRAQGFLVFFGLITMFGYNAMLCIYYAFVIGFKMKEVTIKKRVEPFLHLLPLAFGSIGASAPFIIGGVYTPSGDPWCTLEINLESTRITIDNSREYSVTQTA